MPSINPVETALNSILEKAQTAVGKFVESIGNKLYSSIPSVLDITKQSITVAKNTVTDKKSNADVAQSALISTASKASGAISTVALAFISISVTVIGALLLLFIVPCTRITLEEIGKRAERFTRETIRELKQVVPNPLVYLLVVILSIPYAFVTAVFLPFIRNIQFYLIALVIILIWLYVFEFNKEATIQFIDHMTRTSVMGTNIGLKMFDYGVQIGNIALPVYNDAVHGSVNTIIAIYDALSKQSLDLDLADLDENVDITTISSGRLLAIKPAKRLTLSSKLKKTIITYIGLNQIQVSLAAVVIGIALGSGLGPILVRALVIFYTFAVKLFCTIVDIPCAIREYSEFVFNLILSPIDRFLDIFRTLIPFRQLGPVYFACGERDFLSITPSQCAGGVATVNPPGLFRGLIKKTARRLDSSVISCDYFDGSFVEYYQTELLHKTTNDTIACEHIYKALTGKLQALLVMEKIDYTEACIDVCHLGTLIEICPEQDEYVKIVGTCIQPPAKKKRRLIKKFKYGGMFKQTQFVSNNNFTSSSSTSKFHLIQDLKSTVPLEFTLDGFECNLQIQNNLDIYEIATNLGCLVSYVLKSKNIDYKNIFSNLGTQDVHVRRILNDYNNEYQLFDKHKFRQFLHYSTSNDDIIDYFVPKNIDPDIDHRRELQNKKSPWMMPCPSSTDPNQILCFTDMKTCVTSYSDCPELNLDSAPSELQYLGYQYTKIMSAFDSFEPIDYLSSLNDCWREYRDPSKDPMKKVNLEKTIEEQRLLTYCPPMIKPSIWQPEFVQVSATGLADLYICQSSTQFDGCYCPGYYDSDVLIKYYEAGTFSPYVIYVFSNGLLSIWYLLTNVAPISVIMTAFVPANTIAHWNVINSDLTGVERGLCFGIHFGSLGMTLWIASVVYLFASMIAKMYLISERYLFMDDYIKLNQEKKD